MYRTAIVGVGGPRAKGHAAAYQFVQGGKIVAVSSRDRAKLDEFADGYGVSARYTDYREMFARERLDLVHVNTPPTVRLDILRDAEEAGIPAVLIEKPIAVEGEDYERLCEFAAGSRMKVAINHQLHYHPRRATLQGWVASGRIGAVRFVEASAGDNMAYQGTHTLQAISAFHPDASPRAVIAQVSGANGLRENEKGHYAPDECVAEIAFDDDIRALLHVGGSAPRVASAASPTTVWQHKRVSVYGSRGYVNWTMWSWEANLDGESHGGRHDYWEEDRLGQARLTESMFEWLENPAMPHPLAIQRALQQFNVVLGAYMSALDHALVQLPVAPLARLMDRLRERLSQPAPR